MNILLWRVSLGNTKMFAQIHKSDFTFSLIFRKSKRKSLKDYVDSDFAWDKDNRRSTSTYFSLSVVLWKPWRFWFSGSGIYTIDHHYSNLNHQHFNTWLPHFSSLKDIKWWLVVTTKVEKKTRGNYGWFCQEIGCLCLFFSLHLQTLRPIFKCKGKQLQGCLVHTDFR